MKKSGERERVRERPTPTGRQTDRWPGGEHGPGCGAILMSHGACTAIHTRSCLLHLRIPCWSAGLVPCPLQLSLGSCGPGHLLLHPLPARSGLLRPTAPLLRTALPGAPQMPLGLARAWSWCAAVGPGPFASGCGGGSHFPACCLWCAMRGWGTRRRGPDATAAWDGSLDPHSSPVLLRPSAKSPP